MTWYNSKMSILFVMATSDSEYDARLGSREPKNLTSNYLNGSLILTMDSKYANFELSSKCKKWTTLNFQYRV